MYRENCNILNWCCRRKIGNKMLQMRIFLAVALLTLIDLYAEAAELDKNEKSDERITGRTYVHSGNELFNNQGSKESDNQGNGLASNARPNQVTSSTETTSRTTQSTLEMKINECIQRCPSTNQYNPVCGDDNNTYMNENKLKCAQQCKRRVQVNYRGTCVTTAAPPEMK